MRKLVIVLMTLLMPLMAFGARYDSYTLQWSAIGTSTADAVPDENAVVNGTTTTTADYAIPVSGAYTIFISCSTLNSDVTNASTNIDIDVAASSDGTNYDTTGKYYVEDFIADLADNSQDSDGLTPGPMFIKLRLDNDDGSNTAGAKCRVEVKWLN